MKTRVHPMWLLASLAVLPAAQAAAGATPAADPQPTSSDMKVAIDPATGKIRPLSRGEARALEVQSAAKGRRAIEPLGAGKKGFVMPATEAEAAATRRVLPSGAVLQQVPESMMSTLQVTRAADGSLHMHHEGEQSQVDAEELPNE